MQMKECMAHSGYIAQAKVAVSNNASQNLQQRSQQLPRAGSRLGACLDPGRERAHGAAPARARRNAWDAAATADSGASGAE